MAAGVLSGVVSSAPNPAMPALQIIVQLASGGRARGGLTRCSAGGAAAAAEGRRGRTGFAAAAGAVCTGGLLPGGVARVTGIALIGVGVRRIAATSASPSGRWAPRTPGSRRARRREALEPARDLFGARRRIREQRRRAIERLHLRIVQRRDAHPPLGREARDLLLAERIGGAAERAECGAKLALIVLALLRRAIRARVRHDSAQMLGETHDLEAEALGRAGGRLRERW